MSSFCLKCRKSTESKNPKVMRSKNGKIMFLCEVCKSNKLIFFKEQEAKGSLSGIEIKTPLS